MPRMTRRPCPIRALLPAALLVGCGTDLTRSDASGGAGGATAASVGASTVASSGAGAGSMSSSSSSQTAGAGGSSPSPCETCTAGRPAGNLANAQIDEASGLVASQAHPGFYYVHNDSGDVARFFAIDAAGADHGVYGLDGVSANDWEDAALGPCGTQSCLYLGDIGDNPESRASYVVHRVVEPSALAAGEHTVSSEALPFVYPDGSHNAETLIADRASGELWVVTKVASGPSGVYRFPAPLTPGVEVTLVKEGEITPPMGVDYITAGDAHPGGLGVLLRTYTNVFFYAGASVGAALGADPCLVPGAFEIQGETVAWTATGDGYRLVSEGSGVPINVVSCLP